jgi:hypothetical protein
LWAVLDACLTFEPERRPGLAEVVEKLTTISDPIEVRGKSPPAEDKKSDQD